MPRSVEERARWFSWRRQLLGHAGRDDPLEVLRAVVAVYSSQPTGPLSLLARMRGLEAEAYQRLVGDRLVLRIPAMRGSVHLIPADTAAQVRAGTAGSMKLVHPGLRYYKISEDRYERLKREIVRLAREPMTTTELRAELGEDARTTTAVLGAACREAVVLRATGSSLRSNAMTWVAANAWLDGGLPKARPAEARRWLAGEYLRAFGPVRVEDFAWWSGLDARAAREALGSLATVELGDGYLIRHEDEREFSGIRARRGEVALLPKWDAYQMGYAPDGRVRFADEDVLGRVYEGSGDGLPMILAEGRAVGVWGTRFAGKTMNVTLELFEKAGKALETAIGRELDGVAALLGASAVAVTRGTVTRRT